MRTYAIGDIHGHLEALRAAHDRIAEDRRACGDDAAPVVHIGDLVDRGPDSAGVIDCLATGVASGNPWVVLKGNHDRMFAGFLADPGYQDPCLKSELDWLDPRLGGIETLASYEIADPGRRAAEELHAEAQRKVPESHRALLDRQALWHLRGEVLFVHAGIRPGVGLHAQSEDDLVWIRAPFLDDPRDHGALVVHGHTAIRRPAHFGNRVDIDSSVAYGGPLTAVVVEGREVYELTGDGRRHLPEGSAFTRPPAAGRDARSR